MPKSEIGLRGYIGEAIVNQWLNRKYPISERYEVISQIIPDGVPKKGGPYLDFGVIKDNIVKEVYEVKTQDYIFDKTFNINISLEHIWKNKDKIFEFKDQNGKEFKCDGNLKGYLILLAPPNKDGRERLGENIKYVKLFSDIFDDPNYSCESKEIFQNSEKDFVANIEHLKHPKERLSEK
jgi:hypothetical protein